MICVLIVCMVALKFVTENCNPVPNVFSYFQYEVKVFTKLIFILIWAPVWGLFRGGKSQATLQLPTC